MVPPTWLPPTTLILRLLTDCHWVTPPAVKPTAERELEWSKFGLERVTLEAPVTGPLVEVSPLIRKSELKVKILLRDETCRAAVETATMKARAPAGTFARRLDPDTQSRTIEELAPTRDEIDMSSCQRTVESVTLTVPVTGTLAIPVLPTNLGREKLKELVRVDLMFPEVNARATLESVAGQNLATRLDADAQFVPEAPLAPTRQRQLECTSGVEVTRTIRYTLPVAGPLKGAAENKKGRLKESALLELANAAGETEKTPDRAGGDAEERGDVLIRNIVVDCH